MKEHFGELDIRALLEALVTAEKIKPTQVAKREVFRRYGILGTRKDRVFTAIIYGLGRSLGIVDNIIHRALGIEVSSLDRWTRALLRIYVYVNSLSQVRDPELVKALRTYGPLVIAEEVSKEQAWKAREYIKKLSCYVYKPQSEEEELELRFKVSAWLVRRLIEMLGREEALAFFEHINRLPSLGFRVNTLKADVDVVLRTLRSMGVEVWLSPYVKTVVKYRGSINYEELDILKQGLVVPQDDASALASILLGPRPGEVVVDMCAAPGGKTTHLGELMKNKGLVIAIEIYRDRVEHLKNLVSRVGLDIVEVIQGDARTASNMLGHEIADKVLLDPPCSSTGALAKHAEARWRLNPERLNQLVDLQKKLLVEALKLVKVGGRILYTVCSILPEEGEHVIEWILSEYQEYVRLVPLSGPFDPGFIPGTMRAWPHKHDTTGFFYALLEKVRSIQNL